MGDGELILVAGALLAAGLVVALLATRVRVPASLLFLASGWRSAPTGRAGSTSRRLRARAHRRRHRARPDPLRGRPTSGLLEIRPVLAPGDLPGDRRDDRHGDDLRPGRLWLLDLTRSKACSSAPSSRRPTAPRPSPCSAARRSSEGSRRTSKPSPVSTTRSRSCSCSASSSGWNTRIRIAGHGAALRGGARGRPRRGVAIGWLSVGVAAARLEPAASTRSPPLPRRRRSRSAPPTRCVARASSPSTSPGSRSARRDPGEAARSRPSTRGWRWVAQIALFLFLGLLVFPSDLGDVWLEGTVLALVVLLVARPVSTFWHRLLPFRCASASSSRRPGCAVPSRSCSPPSRSSTGRREA